MPPELDLVVVHVVMTMHKVSAGDGYTYLTRHLAGGDVPRARGQDLADYYTARGNPPGRWIGSAAPLLGLDGVVSEAQMKALFGHGQHPDADAMIRAYLSEHLSPRLSPVQRAKVLEDARKHAALGAAFAVYKSPDNYESRVADRLERIAAQTGRAPTPYDEARVRKEEAGTSRAGVAGYDLVFTPVKSASILWGLHPDVSVRRAIGEAHAAAVASAMRLVEEHAAFTRTGKAGIAQVDTHGLVAASFDHFDNRNGDPNLHTHVVVANKVRVNDGRDAELGERWRTLDARALYRLAVAASEHYSTAFQQQVKARTGFAFEQRGDTNDLKSPVMEIAGVPIDAVWLFSSRRQQLTARLAELLADYRAIHGHSAPENMRFKLARQANLETREAKKAPRSLHQMQEQWREQYTDAFGSKALDDLASAIRPQPSTDRTGSGAVDIDAVAAGVVAAVAEHRSTWTRWNVHAHAERVLRADPALLLDPEQHHEVVARIVETAVSPAHSVQIEAPAAVDVPGALRRADEASVFSEHAAGRYTSAAILDAEQRLVTAAKTSTTHALDPAWVAAVLDGFEAETGSSLDPGQRHLATVFATDPRLLVAAIGPAGAGKTTAMKAYAHVAATARRRVIPLAPSATAAGVLAKELGIPADSIAKFVWEHTRGTNAEQLTTGRNIPPSKAAYAVAAGDVILVDEAGMAGTLALDRIRAIADRHGALIRPLGDDRQLGAVESGGALSLIAAEAGAVELDTVHRFNNRDEATATLKLRAGDTTGLDFHDAHGRIRGGEHDDMIDAVYQAWKTDMDTGRNTLMLAPSAADVVALSARARADRVTAGHVAPDGLPLHNGNTAGAGDWIITRDNNRLLTVNGARDFVRNGSIWKVLTVTDNGGLHVEHHTHKGRLTLPPGYVNDHVELAYAATVTRAQGVTTDTIHALITPGMTRENLYVAATRGRDGAWLYAVTHHRPDHDNHLDAARRDPAARTAREVLDTVLCRAGNEASATHTIRDNQDDAASLATLVPQYLHALSEATTTAHRELVRSALGPEIAEQVTADDAFAALSAVLNKGTATGWQPERLLTHAVRISTLHGTQHPAALLAHHAGQLIAELTPPAPLAQPTEAEATRYARLIRGAHTRLTLTPSQATTTPAALSTAPSGDRNEAFTNVPKKNLDAITETVAQHLGLTPNDITRHRAWPHLAATLTSNQGREHGTDLPAAYRASGDITGLARTLRAQHEHTAHPRPRIPSALRHQHHTTITLTPEHADAVRTSRYWPALAAALTAAEKAGHDPVQVLQRAAANHQPTRDCDAALDLAEGVHRQVHLHQTGVTADPTDTWREIAWMLKAHTAAGGNPADIVYRIRTPQDLTRLRDHISTRATRPGLSGDLPWIPAAPAATIPEPWRDHITHAQTAIHDRINHLTTTTLATRPAWATALGEQPETPAAAATWRHCLGIAAAYRDQYRVTSDDPQHPLGAYPEQDRTGHGAYLHAATALIHAHALTDTNSSTPTELNPPTGLNAGVNDRIRHHLAATIYQTLSEDDRHRVAEAFYAQAYIPVGVLSRDEAAACPAFGGRLMQVLAVHGHLADVTPGGVGRVGPLARPHLLDHIEGSEPVAEPRRHRRVVASPMSSPGPPAAPVSAEQPGFDEVNPHPLRPRLGP